ncbi:MAG TPA: condensation domain-containing protein, partial [Solirubrobacteraceae bacterium]
MAETANVFQGSPQQDEQWRRDARGPRGRVQALVNIEGRLEPATLKDALRRVVERHEILRTTFSYSAGIRIPLQAVADDLEPSFEIRQLRAAPAPEQLASLLAGERAAPIDFARGPLIRCLLVALGPDRHLLVITLSSLCGDTSSMPVIVAELAHHLGAGVPLVEDPLQYADFAAWQAELSEAGDEEARAARQTWAELAATSSPGLPFAR